MKKLTRKKRKQDSDEETIDRLQSEIRELKSTIRSLQKRLKKVDRGYKDSDEEPKASKKHAEPEFTCHNCGKGYLVTNTGIPGRVFKSCTSCDYKSKIEKLK